MLIACALITVYLATFETTTILLFPVILLITGLAMEFLLEKKRESVDEPVTQSNLKATGYYTILAVFGALVAGYAVSLARFISPFELTGHDALLYSVLMAVSEEQFFRGFITDWLLTKELPLIFLPTLIIGFLAWYLYSYAPSLFIYYALTVAVTVALLIKYKKTVLSLKKKMGITSALAGSATIFMVYHLARYGTSMDSLAYVFFGGLIFAWVAYKSKRLGPTMLGHSLVNIIAVLSGG